MSDDALNDFCDWLEAEAAHTMACPADCPLCLAADKLKKLQAKVEVLETALWRCLAQSDELTDKQFRDKFKRLCGDLFRPEEQEVKGE